MILRNLGTFSSASYFSANVRVTCSFCSLQRVYDDDDEDEEEVAEEEPRGLSDPFPNLKEAFSLGREALKLFFVEDSPEEKFEVNKGLRCS